MTRDEAAKTIKGLSTETREAIAFFVETAEIEGDYYFDGEGSHWEDSATATISRLAAEIRRV